jgi:exopolysaccharide biosynthesis polyprenyl glycosylphosphotransferase
MGKRDTSGFNALQLISDAILTILGIVIAFHLRYETISPRNWQPFVEIWWVLFIGAIVLFYFFQSYHCGEKRVSDSVFAAISALLLLNFFTMAITYFTRGFAYPRSIIAISFFTQSGLLIIWKILIYKIYFKLFPGKTILVFGTQEDNERIFFKLLSGNTEYNKKIFAESYSKEVEQLLFQANEVVVPMDFLAKDQIMKVCFEREIQLSIRPTLHEVSMFATELGQIDDIPILTTKPLGLNQVQRALKRTFDIITSAISVILLSPLYLGVTIAIALEDGFPVFYKQERLTLDNKVFHVMKFRTMIKNAEKESGPVLATGADTRITKVGRILRATRLDEFPQFINVLKGDMSMVGPRPERQFFIEEFSKELPEFQYRTRVKAGITGLGQVLGKYTTTPQDKLTFDMIYIRNYSFLFDIKICFQTFQILFSKTAAKGFTHADTFQAIKQNDAYKVEEGKGYFIVKK